MENSELKPAVFLGKSIRISSIRAIIEGLIKYLPDRKFTRLHTTPNMVESLHRSQKSSLHERWIKLVTTFASGSFRTLYCYERWNEFLIHCRDVVRNDSSSTKTILTWIISKFLDLTSFMNSSNGRLGIFPFWSRLWKIYVPKLVKSYFHNICAWSS